MPLPEHYDDFDPEAHDLEQERLEAVLHAHWLADLRNLQSEADAARKERKRAAKPVRYKERRAAFEAMDPPPSDKHDYMAGAEWEWRWLEYLYTQMESEYLLNRHHLERGSFIERHAARMRRSHEWVETEFFGPLRERAREQGSFVPEPWPEGDGVSHWRARLDQAMDPEEVEEEMAAREEPSYARAKDLRAALLGWWRSLPEEARDFAHPLDSLIKQAKSGVIGAYEPDYAPGNIGRHLHQMRKALGHAQDALDLLNDLDGEWWLTPAAHTRLTSLVEDLRDASLDRYVEMRAIYDGYLEQAERRLGGTKWTPPEEDEPAGEAPDEA